MKIKNDKIFFLNWGWGLGIGDWGLGSGDWGLRIGTNTQYTKPKTQKQN